MNVLFAGDVVGRPGRRVLLQHIASLRAEFKLDLVIANAENAAGGFGITRNIAKELLQNGVDVLSNGNHAWDKKEALQFIDSEPRLLRPHNYPVGTPGSGWYVAETAAGTRLGILNVMGTVFMHPVLNCPFHCVDQVLKNKPADVDAVLVDFHAEASSEKTAMGWYLDGRVSAVVGTHIHVPTADERILPGGTAYISDVGMTGCYDSVIGMNTERVLQRFVRKISQPMEVAEGKATLCAVLLDIDEHSGKSRSIKRIAIEED